MIKFFRKIRQNLLMENKKGKYFKYAIGEIVLVVIGILIALSINDWNSDRKSKLVQHDYYRQIIDDLDKETDNINERMQYLDSSILASATYWEYVETPNLEPSAIFDEMMKVDMAFRYLAFNTNTIQTLESTGDIKLMPEEIRNSLIELKRTQDQLSRVAKGNYGTYLSSHMETLQMGLIRLRSNVPAVDGLDIENKIPAMIINFEGGLALKTYTDKLVRGTLIEMLSDIDDTRDLILNDLNENE